ncbi:MAG: phosphatidate cytidylyltransferase [Candidatus Caenarcaniphilales bacterium]|nr:phosphatidate cytidylyltransferase [Candidatus Caenarcaniphilales bacterium]
MKFDTTLFFYAGVVLTVYTGLGIFIWLKPLDKAKQPYLTWLILLPSFFLPLFLGIPFWIGSVMVLSLYGFFEFARGTDLPLPFRIPVYLSIIGLALCSLAHKYGLFMSLPIWGIALITTIPILRNEYQSALRHTGTAVIGLIYFGWFCAHLGYLALSEYGLGYLLFVLIATQFNDALAFLYGKLFGKHHWTKLSPNKTIEGSLLALLTTTALAFAHWKLAFPHFPWWLVLLSGLMVGIGGQVGDLVMSCFKRDLNVKDFGSLLPGHGGVLDRIDSLLWVAPLFFHMARFFEGGFP